MQALISKENLCKLISREHIHNFFSPYCGRCVKKSLAVAHKRDLHVWLRTQTSANTAVLRDIVSKTQTHRQILALQPRNVYQICNFSALRIARPILRAPSSPYKVIVFSQRDMSVIGRLAGGFGRFLRVRYLILTGAVGGGVAVNKVGGQYGSISVCQKTFEHTGRNLSFCFLFCNHCNSLS